MMLGAFLLLAAFPFIWRWEAGGTRAGRPAAAVTTASGGAAAATAAQAGATSASTATQAGAASATAGSPQATTSAGPEPAGGAAAALVDTPFGRVPRALPVPLNPAVASDLHPLPFTPAEPFDASSLQSEAAILIDATTGDILFQKNADEELPPASVTKLMTLDLAFDAVEDGRLSPDAEFPVSVRAWRTGGSSMFLDPSMKVRLRDLLYGVAVDSGNDATVVLAEGLRGSVEAFVETMNAHAKELGMAHTHFVTPNGLPAPGHYSAASDLARLARHYLNAHPEALVFHSTRQFTFNEITQYNQNPLLIHDYPGADGLKTGFASDCFNLVGTARRGDTRLIVVTLCARSEAARYQDASRLLDWGFANFETLVALRPQAELGAVPVPDGRRTEVPVRAAAPVALTVPRAAGATDGVRVELAAAPSLKPPLLAGQVVGEARVQVGGRLMARVPVVAAADVAKAPAWTRFGRRHPHLRAAVVLGALAAGAAGLLAWDRARRRRRRLRRFPALRYGGAWGGGSSWGGGWPSDRSGE
ncbi:MAG: D-alanyl-D-alanine carboxypeptidase [Firmicutes bacterium]|nr:D-alanyl-D-alanine carboxypeptidase [Bacillota bacterium]